MLGSWKNSIKILALEKIFHLEKDVYEISGRGKRHIDTKFIVGENFFSWKGHIKFDVLENFLSQKRCAYTKSGDREHFLRWEGYIISKFGAGNIFQS